MRLVVKVFAVLAAVIALSVALNYVVLSNTVLPAFMQLEKANSEENMRRVIDAIEGDLRSLGSTARDWAFWDDSYEFILDEPDGHRADYIDANLDAESLIAVNLDAMLFLDGAGRVVWGMVLAAGSWEEIEVEGLPRDSFPADSPLLRHSELTEVVSGILRTGQGPMLTASASILTSDQTGPAVGTIVIGRFLRGRTEAALRDQTHVDFELIGLEDSRLDPAILESLTAAGDEEALRTTIEGDTTNVFALLRDVGDAPMLVVHASSPRDIVALGREATGIALTSLLVAGLVVMAVIGLMLQSVVLSPITGLTRHILAIRRTGDLSQRVAARRTDEIGILSAGLNDMLEELSEARSGLLDRSYKAGIAEMASGVLHNVRNQMNSVTMRLGTIRRRMSASSSEKTDRALEELVADRTLSPRSAKLVRYLRLSANQSGRERESTLADLEALTLLFARIDQVLSDQDRLARVSRVVEPVALSEVVAHAIERVPDLEEGGIDVAIDPALAKAPPVSADRFILTHVLEALLQNGVEAIGADGAEGGRIDVSAKVGRSADGGTEIDLAVKDNGSGIATDPIGRIFERGYSTKRGGGGGFGLHWCANTIGDLGGRIHAESRGPDQGATFHVVLPAATARAQEAA